MNAFVFWVVVGIFFLAIVLLGLSSTLEMSSEKKRQRIWWAGIILIVLNLVILLCFPESARAQMQSISTEYTQGTKASYILQKVNEADNLCNSVSMKEYIVATDTRITERPVALCAFKESDQSWHVIRVAIMQPVPDSYKSCAASAPTVAARADCSLPYHVVTQGYHVEHVAGYGIARMTFNVSQAGEHLIVYRMRHVWFDDGALAGGDPLRVIATAVAINYTPYHPDFKDPQLVSDGLAYLSTRVKNALSDLRTRGVMSKAYPGELVADVVPVEIPIAIAAIEQSDDKKFQEEKRGTTEAVFIEYALNRERAFMWSQSVSPAIGAMQFTRRTYESIARDEYVEAQLNLDFMEGSRNLDNVLKAAICLVDLEVSNFSGKREVINLYRENPLLGGIYPVAAYNGGPVWAQKLYQWIKQNRIDLAKENVELPNTLVREKMSCPCHIVRTKVKGTKHIFITRNVMQIVRSVNSETPGYVEKYLYVINYLADSRPSVAPQS